MGLRESEWAWIGKGLAAVATLVGVVVGLLQIGQTLSGPQINAVVSIQRGYLSPKVRQALKERTERSAILEYIEESQKNSETPATVLESVKARLKEPDKADDAWWATRAATGSTYLHVVIQNASDVVAKDVRLILPGKGTAETSETGYFDSDAPAVRWDKELQIGALRPESRVEILVWPEEPLLFGLYGVNAAVTHAGGSGRVRYLQSFYGWDADLVAWFIAQPWFIRHTIAAFAALLLVIAFRFLLRKGFINFRPRRPAPAAELPERSPVATP